MAASLPSQIQASLRNSYRLEDAPSVDDFIRPIDGLGREVFLIREDEEGAEVALHLPRVALASRESSKGDWPSFDELCQIVEGVSHFLYFAERARRELPLTQLELELQAEVDKYVLFVHGSLASGPFEPTRAAEVRELLFEPAVYLDAEGTERGDRYRLANDLARRYACRLEKSFAQRGHFSAMWRALRCFYAAGQSEKISLARAA